MADVFNINWADRMKTDPKANSILNNTAKYESFYTYRMQPLAVGGYRHKNPKRVIRKLNQLYSDRYIKDYRHIGPIQPNKRYRYDGRRGFGPYTFVGDNRDKYWENNIGAPLYKKDSIANASNPHIEKLSYKE